MLGWNQADAVGRRSSLLHSFRRMAEIYPPEAACALHASDHVHFNLLKIYILSRKVEAGCPYQKLVSCK